MDIWVYYNALNDGKAWILFIDLFIYKLTRGTKLTSDFHAVCEVLRISNFHGGTHCFFVFVLR